MQVFRPRADTLARIVFASLGAAPVLFIFLGYMITRSSYMTEQDLVREQPVPFSHRHHVGGLGLDCRYCHATVERTATAGMPSTHTCMTCPSQIWTQAKNLE